MSGNINEGGPVDRNRLTWLVLLLGGITFVLGAVEISASIPLLLDRFIPDDAFYYFKPALNFATRGYSSFDGIHFTNGYQPLWFITLLPVFRIFPAGGELPLRLALLIQVCLATISTVLLVRSIYKLFGLIPAAIAGTSWIFWFQSALINGLETTLLMCLYLGLFGFFIKFLQKPMPAVRDAAILGFLSALVFLARTDSVFLVAGISIAVLIDPRIHNLPTSQVMRFLIAFALPVCLISGGYLVTNLIATGHILPVSGAAKIYYSQLARDHTAQETYANLIKIYLANLFWVFEYRGFYFIFLGMVLFIFSAIASLIPGVIRMTRPLLELWPFFLGGIASYAYYSLVYYGIFTRTVWYYAPATFLTCLSLAWLAYAFGQYLRVKYRSTGKSLNRFGMATSLAVIILIAAVLPYLKLRENLLSQPRRWNYNLYLGARWAQDHLPKEATIWSGSAGILGYFSDHTVVNTDGLANDYHFLEEVLKPGKLREYISRWDYAIDAFPVDNHDLQTMFPEGCFVPLPEELVSNLFQDSGTTRRLGVFQMKSQGLVDCNELRAAGS